MSYKQAMKHWHNHRKQHYYQPIICGNFEKKESAMTKEKALAILNSMPEPEFQAWFQKLPVRVRLCVGGGLVNWRDVLPEWYVKLSEPVHVSNMEIEYPF